MQQPNKAPGEERRRPARRRSAAPTFAIAALALIVFAVVVLAPGLSTYLNQRQQIADLKSQIADQRSTLKSLAADEARWSDPAYIRAQAGSRLFYVLPGETVYRIVGGGTTTSTSTVQQPKATVQQTRSDWAGALLGSLLTAGTTDSTTSALSGTSR